MQSRRREPEPCHIETAARGVYRMPCTINGHALYVSVRENGELEQFKTAPLSADADQVMASMRQRLDAFDPPPSVISLSEYVARQERRDPA